jgi:twitching motility two-component system response regulator PilG
MKIFYAIPNSLMYLEAIYAARIKFNLTMGSEFLYFLSRRLMSYKIVVAEDSPSTQKLIQISFPDTEFEIFPFADGKEVLDSLGQISPDAILLNLSLPHKDGYELGEQIKNQEAFHQIPLILIKEAFEPLDKERLGAIEFDQLVQKPFDSAALVESVRIAIEQRKIPTTLPEEPVSGLGKTSDRKVALDETVRELVKNEILDVERELEKRIKARLLAEIKMWLIDSQKK